MRSSKYQCQWLPPPRATGAPLIALRALTHADVLDRRYPTYFGAAWDALGRIMLTTGWLPGSCAPSGM